MHRLATRLRTHLHSRTRGQSLVEFALVLPIIMLLTLTALDFGRVYLGYINLQNMARIAANFAANNPTAWTVSADPIVQANRLIAQSKYQKEVLADAAATNCNLPVVAGNQTAPAPTFTDADGDGTPEIGDVAQVAVSCTFGVITPVISNIVGGSVQVSAASRFPVKSGMTAAMGAAVIGTPPNAAFTGNAVAAPSSLVGTTPFTVVFRDTSGGNPTAWEWHFNDGSTPDPVTSQDPLNHVFDHAGTFLVTMKASNIWGESTTSMGVTVVDPSTANFTISPPSGNAPLPVTFTSTSSSGGTNYAWTFGSGQGSASGASMTSTSHTYNAAGTYSVTLTVTFASGPVSVTKSLTVSAALCTVPRLSGVRRNNAQAAWSGAGFSGLVSDAPGAPNGNYLITSQSLVFPGSQPCTSNVAVSG
jgi:PKD repeat protein